LRHRYQPRDRSDSVHFRPVACRPGQLGRRQLDAETRCEGELIPEPKLWMLPNYIRLSNSDQRPLLFLLPFSPVHDSIRSCLPSSLLYFRLSRLFLALTVGWQDFQKNSTERLVALFRVLLCHRKLLNRVERPLRLRETVSSSA